MLSKISRRIYLQTAGTQHRALSTSATFQRNRAARSNTIVVFVPTRESYIIERFGKFNQILESGLNILIPFVDTIAYVQLLKEQAIPINSQSAITLDNVQIHINGVLYIKVVDPEKASYGVDDPENAITQLAQTSMRAEIGHLTLDQIFKERAQLNQKIVDILNKASEEPWGVQCLRYEIKDIDLPKNIKQAMELEVEAERSKRATILTSEATREAAINVAEGERQAVVRKAQAEADAIVAVAEATARKIEVIGDALRHNGKDAASLAVAEKYVDAFSKVAKSSTTLILPKDAGNIAGTVSTALQTFKAINNSGFNPDDGPSGPSDGPTAKDIEDVISNDLDKFR